MDLLASISNLSEKPAAQLVKQLEKDTALSNASISRLNMLWEKLHLQPKNHTIALIFILNAMANKQDLNPIQFIVRTSYFLKNFDTFHHHLICKQLRFVLSTFINQLFIIKKPRMGISIINAMIDYMTHNNTQITIYHVLFLKLCLYCKFYKSTLSIIQNHFVEIDSHFTGVNDYDVRLYHYYVGIAYIGNNLYEKSIDSFLTCITLPSKQLSAITIEAYKKFTLLCLIHYGKLLDINKLNPNFLRTLKSITEPYHQLTQSFHQNNLDLLKKELLKNKKCLISDKNWGLAKKLVPSLLKIQILNLTKIYMSLSIIDISSILKIYCPRKTEELILDLIEKHYISAKISKKNNIVTFFTQNTNLSSYSTTELLTESLKCMTDLSSFIKKKANENKELNVRWLLKSKANITAGAPKAQEMGI